MSVTPGSHTPAECGNASATGSDVIPETDCDAATSAPSKPAHPFSLAQLGLLAALGGIAPLAIDTYLASMPDVARDLQTSVSAVQLTLTGFLVGMAIGPLFAGPISDRYGRYKLIVGGIVALLVASVACALAPSIEVLIAARVLQGFCGSIAMTLSRTLVADVVSGAAAARIYSLLSTIMGVSPIVAPIIGGVIQQWGHWRYTFWLLVVISGALAIGVLLLLKETLPPERRHTGGLAATFRNAGRVLTDSQFVAYTAASAFVSGALFSYISASPFVIQEILGFGPLAFSLIFAANAGGLMVSAGISTALVVRHGPARLTSVGAGIIAVGSLGLALAVATGTIEAWLLLPAMFLIPTGGGFMFGNATAVAVERVGYAAGTAMAVLSFVQFGSSGLVAPLVSLAGPKSIVPLAIISIVSSLLMVCAVFVGSRIVAGGRIAARS